MDRPIEKKKWPPKKIALFSLIGIVLAVALYSLLFRDSRSRLNVDPERITIATVDRGAFQEFIPVTGNVLPIKTIFLDAMEGGRVEKIYLDAGTLV
ncbi:MAG: efflux transporter periplasmic adaptor subunit, partial [Candidatus Latescibacterota bacterium]